MTYAVKMRQARCAALGFWPGPIDGKEGRRTRGAYAEAVAAQRAKGLPFQHASGISILRPHWTAGGYKPNAVDRKAYQALIDGDGCEHVCHPDIARLAHTLNANGGAVGISICAMMGAVERPFSRGPAPILAIQLHGLVRAIARRCRLYDIPVSPYSIHTHAEVQPLLGIVQRWKWDITWLPGMECPGRPMDVGNRIRAMVAAELSKGV